MKSIVKIVLCLFLLLCPYTLNASSGRLVASSIKTCSNGVKYGKHSDHWHKAVKRNGVYYASGSAIKKDPCPPKSDDNDLKSLSIDGESISIYGEMEYETYNNNIKIVAKPYDSKAKVSTNYNGLKAGRNEIEIKVTAESGKKQYYKLIVERLLMDTSIKSLSIDDNNIIVSDKMEYETYNKDININIVPNDESVKVSNDYNSLKVGGNSIKIVLTASNGDKSTYYLDVILKEEKEAEEEIKEEIVVEEENVEEVVEEKIIDNIIGNDEVVEEDVIEEVTIEEEPVVEEIKNDLNNKLDENKESNESEESDSSGIMAPLVLAIPAVIVIKKIKKK